MRILQQNKSIFLGNSPFGKQDMDIRDRIAQKKQLYQKNAMHIVSTAFKAEKSIDDGIEERRERVRQLTEEKEMANAYLNEYKQKMAQAKKDYKIEDGSQEQKDLELLQKEYYISKHPGELDPLTDEERAQLDAIKEKGLTEYQQLSMDSYVQADYWKTIMDDNTKEINGESGAIRKIKIDRLESHVIVDAETAKEQILDAANKEIIGMIVDDAKEKIDDKAEEVKETAEERKEKEEEQEERIEAAKENKSEAEEAVKNIRENIADLTEQMAESEDIMQDVNNNIKKIIQDQKLLEEDIKGLTVDEAT